MARNPSETLIDVLQILPPNRSLDGLADTIRDSFKLVILTQAAYDALSPKDSNTIYITIN